MKFLLLIHPAFSFTIVSMVFVILAILCLIIVRRKFPERYLKEHHDVVGHIFHAFGVIYAVLVAFVVFVTWSSYDTTKKNIEMEANKIAVLFMNARVFDDETKKSVRESLVVYTRSIIEEDWPNMASGGKRSKVGRKASRHIRNTYLNIDAKKIKNVYIYEESIRQLNAMTEYRWLRRFSSMSTTPCMIWIVLIVGAVVSVIYTFFFGTRHFKAQCFVTSAYTIFNSMVLLLIYILDHPFTGYNAISNEPFQMVLRLFIKIVEHSKALH